MRRYENTTQFYNGIDWANCKAQVINERFKDKPIICEHCGKIILKTFNPNERNNKGAIVFHHIKELNNINVNDASISINPKNIMVVHWQCHNEIHNRFNGVAQKVERKVYLITGASCSGKTTFVRERVQEGDIVLDIDDIWETISGMPRYVKPNQLKPIVFNIRNTLKEQIAKGVGTWRNAFIIESLPIATDRKREAERYKAHNVELITMEATREECLQRLYSRPDGRNIKAYEEYINDYYDNYI
jgi:predicted kinase/DNA-directed RNA polymerase subunit RPC12/RpoP